VGGFNFIGFRSPTTTRLDASLQYNAPLQSHNRRSSTTFLFINKMARGRFLMMCLTNLQHRQEYDCDYDCDYSVSQEEAESWYPELGGCKSLYDLHNEGVDVEMEELQKEEAVLSADPVVISEQQKPLLASVRLPEKLVPVEKSRIGYKAHKIRRRKLHKIRVADKGKRKGSGLGKQPRFDLSYDVEEAESGSDTGSVERRNDSDSGSETEADPLE